MSAEYCNNSSTPIKPKRGRKPKNATSCNTQPTRTGSTTNHTTQPIHAVNTPDTTDNNINVETKIPAKRGRKPKGSKIIQQQCITTFESSKQPRHNIVLHLKCYVRDLECSNSETYHTTPQPVASYCCKDMPYETVNNSASCTHYVTSTNTSELVSIPPLTSQSHSNSNVHDKLRDLRLRMHLNNVPNKQSACFRCTYDFNNLPTYIPYEYSVNTGYRVYGCFCSPECAAGYLFNQHIDHSIMFERYQLLNHLYSDVYKYKTHIKPSPDPMYMLDKFYGNMTIDEYRNISIGSNKLYTITNKPITQYFPEIHEDNDDMLLRKKLIPSYNQDPSSEPNKSLFPYVP